MIINSYATLAEFKAYTTPRGQTVTTDAADDVVVSMILDEASRWIETKTNRTFYPRYETRYFNELALQNEPTSLFLDDDLLEAVTVTNGDGSVVLSTAYNGVPRNYSPYYAIQTVPSSALWYFNGTNNILIEGWWGFHSRYTQRGWTQIGTLGAAITTTTALTFTATAGHTLAPDTIVKIDNELFNVTTVATNTITVSQRGDNGSTAATHLVSAPVYVWNVQPEIKTAALQRAEKVYMERLGVMVKSDSAVKYSDPDLSRFVKIL